MMNLQQAKMMLQARGIQTRLVGDGATSFQRVHTDTRSLQAGDLFVALKGERFDANDFLHEAKTAGASAALAHQGLVAAGLNGLEVADSKQALGALAAAWRASMTLPVIAVTGSNGKTTVTQMVASILRAAYAQSAWATKGNLNNDIGVPLTLLGLKAAHRMAVIELGMNHPGEIAALAEMTQASVAIVNNAQREHLEFMQTVEAVARENGSVISALPADGVAVFPADDAYAALWRSMAGTRRCISFALTGNAADVTGSCDWEGDAWRVRAATPLGALSFRLAIAGQHNVKNALAAVAACAAAGVPLDAIAKGLESFEAVKGRSRALSVRVSSRPITVVDDTYNANPDSVRAAIDVLADLPAPHLLVLGDMGEVGDLGPEFHAEIGEYAAERGIETLLCMGELMRYGAAVFPGARHCGGIDALNACVLADLAQYRSVLVKGSRFMKMERVVDAIIASGAQTITTTPLEAAHAA
ncbi:MAG: UDP-N-acetylmuramoyl-tripeptide--D-alanyl-D-alanine ligase [Burkholderiaceae bacterium]